MLELRGITKRFGGVTALESVDLTVVPGTLLSLIGPNGSGKTTLFNIVTSIHRPDSGTISFEGVDVTGLRPHEVTGRGIARTFQNIRVSADLNAIETVMVGRHARTRSGLVGSFLGSSAERARTERAAEELLHQVGLFDKRHAIAKSLAPGDQKRLEIARALATEPRLLLLDEPVGGLSGAEITEILDLIARLRARGATIFLIEHDMRVVMSISDRVAVLKYGNKIAEGSPAEVQKDPAVVEAYLGGAVKQPARRREGLDANAKTILRIKDLQVRYGANPVIKGISLEANRGDVRVILGANGAGKTTILKTIMGVLKASAGQIEFPLGRTLQGLAPHAVARLGISLCPERRGILAQMSVRENLEMGAFFKKDRSSIEKNLAMAFERFPVLASRQRQPAGSLSGGEQQMLAISRSLMGDPELVLMDEPSVGLAPLVMAEIFEAIREISRTGVTILLVEQNARQALQIADWGYVLETGVVIAQGSPEQLLRDETIRKAYLGG